MTPSNMKIRQAIDPVPSYIRGRKKRKGRSIHAIYFKERGGKKKKKREVSFRDAKVFPSSRRANYTSFAGRGKKEEERRGKITNTALTEEEKKRS